MFHGVMLVPNDRRYVLFAAPGASRRAGAVFAIAALLEMLLFVFQVIAPLPQTIWD
jgi:hypothetical protein